jgi:hypothetical protein
LLTAPSLFKREYVLFLIEAVLSLRESLLLRREIVLFKKAVRTETEQRSSAAKRARE